ncbi:YihY/virulence factor BrkB family protein [Vallicoccus soli]|uniref:YihY/virulence factor BrkB family protein n=1 Tax=Vallicoccus soli TaxID=2339232 RepID=UPI001C49C2CB|nr:YihY/virulence factor BrkB family protein [Vallicoccus soli]
MATGTASSAGAASRRGSRARARYRLRDAPAVLWRLVAGTTACVFRYRVTGLSAEAGFFALLSLPPLVLGLVGSIGYLGGVIGRDVVGDIKDRVVEAAATLLTEQGVSDVIVPTLDQVLDGGRIDLVSLGFLLALWSGSRALNVYVDTITIMYGQSGRRGIVRTRALSFSLYVLALGVGSVVVPLVLLGPSLLGDLLPPAADWLLDLYWPVVVALCIAVLTSLYHVAVPDRTPWRRDVPGAVLAMAIWVLGSYGLRWVISVSVDGTSIYGPLSAPIVVLLWLYVLAIAVLIGAALNATVMQLWPLPQDAPALAAQEATAALPAQEVHVVRLPEAVGGAGVVSGAEGVDGVEGPEGTPGAVGVDLVDREDRRTAAVVAENRSPAGRAAP